MSPYIIDIFLFNGGYMEREINFFEDFISKFDKNNKMIIHKYNHTYRVVEYAKEIAKSLDLSNKEYIRASVCALFHDLGRFPQARDYNTFIDAMSFDHGDKGYEILKENNYNDEIVLKAVKYHNKKELPNFDELTNMHLKIVRDADKIDIMTMFGNKECDNNSIISEEIMNCFKNHKLLDNSMGDTELIYSLRNLAFIFDINYKKTMETIIEKELIPFKLNIIRSNTNKEQVDIIEKELKKYIKERFDLIC